VTTPEEPALDPTRPAREQTAKKAGHPVVRAFSVLVVVFSGMFALLAITAALAGLGLWWALGLSLIPAWGLPLFLGLRAAHALKQKGLGPLLRRSLLVALILLVQLTSTLVVFEWVGRSSGDVAATLLVALDETVGNVPVLSGVLEKYANDEKSEVLEILRTPAPVADGGVVDGGAASADGGIRDAEAADAKVGDKSAESDAGTATVDVAAAGAPKGPAVLRAVSVVKTRVGVALVVHHLDKAGVHSARTVSLEPHADAGNPTAARVSPNGNGVVVIGGRDVFVFDETRPLEKVRPLARGYTVRAGDIVERIHDAAVDDDGNLLVVADVVFAETPDKRPRAALLAWDPKRPMTYTVVRKAGDAVVDAPEGSVADRFRLQSVGSDGSVTVVEAFLEGGVGQAKDTSSQAFVQNPERLLVGHLDRMSSLREIARTDDAAGGLPRRALHAFLDGVSLPDGRVFFDANFKEEGRAGWLFVSARDAVTAVARPRYPDGAPWAPRAPRLRDLGVDFDGNALFIDGKLGRRLAFGPIENLENTRVFGSRAPATRA
jgi:hypothetical protein